MRFNRIFTDNNKSDFGKIARYHRARVIETYQNDNPIFGEQLFVRANLINERKEQQLANQEEQYTFDDISRDPLKYYLTEILIIPKPGVDPPQQKDEILVSLMSNEETRILNIDGYCERIIKSYSSIKLALDKVGDSLGTIGESISSFFSTNNPQPMPNTDQAPEISESQKQLLAQAKKVNNQIEDLNTEARQKVSMLLQRIEEEGLPMKLYETRRSQLRQEYLYSKSRTTEQLRAAGVTNFDGQPQLPWATGTLNSNHKGGNAVDMVLDLRHPYWDGKRKPKGAWDTSSEFMHIWYKYRKIANEVGLYTFGTDWPHASTRRG